ncbi:MAG: HAMP domain-containing histidine kinase [Kofleriaceae bacterium]|nr:HAMP domain-containing histidine kinase [Kofleriaceae bacterium]MBP9172647.1 HAMP domain-containing histidine kinase [Kofleriaceae bacterium]MBP9863714.1 HAMP domain-containing histidine kinase [Kofleriaceae bacterium]
MRVLILEDDPIHARAAAAVVGEGIGWAPIIASSLEGARGAALVVGARYGGRPTAAIVAAARADERHRPIVIACAAGDADGIAEAAALVGPLAVVTRPVTAAELLPRLAAQLERARHLATIDELSEHIESRDRALASTRGAAERATAALATTSSELATATERLVTAEQLAAVGRVVTGIAHELGQQLALVGYAEALKARVADDPELVELADVIVGAQRRLLAMVDAIRDFTGAAGPPVAHEPVDLVTIVDDALALLRHDPLVRRRALHREVGAHPLCLGHRGKLAQVVINLVHNAALATAPGEPIEIAIADAGDDATITVRDRGVGMAPEVVARLGEPFFTTRGDRGSGLGVGICRRIVEEHGGTLAFSSAPGQGTTAVVHLPAVAGAGRP